MSARRYELDGTVIDIPIYYDEQVQRYIEDYPDFIAHPIRTKSGYRVLFSGMDACRYACSGENAPCADCAGCRYYQSAGAHTWFGLCMNKESPVNQITEKGAV